MRVALFLYGSIYFVNSELKLTFCYPMTRFVVLWVQIATNFFYSIRFPFFYYNIIILLFFVILQMYICFTSQN